MHRSGTSCLAGSLEQAGVFLGDVVHQSPHNKKGNKENKALRLLNEDLLHFNQGSWDLIPAELNWNADLCARRDALLADYDLQPLWAFKDPRCLITLPFWREALPTLSFVGTFRNPAAVVRSLHVRQGMMPKTSPLNLWIEYNRKLLDLCQTERVPLLSFDWDQASYQTALDKVKDEFGLHEKTDKPVFYESGLINASDKETLEDMGCPADLQVEALCLYRELQALAIDVTPYKQSEVSTSGMSVAEL